MKYWNSQDIAAGGRVPRKIARINDAVVDVLDEYGWPGAKVVRVGRSDHDLDCNRFEVDVELTPGVVLPTYRGTHESLLEGWEHKWEDVEILAMDVAEGVDACRDRLPALGDILHDLRLRARKVIAGWQRDGVQVEFVEVRLAPYDHWRGGTVPKALVLFERHGEHLRREVAEVHVEAPADLERELESSRPVSDEREEARLELGEAGASGSIDQLALNAIALFEDVPAFLRRYATQDRIWLPDSTAVHFYNGHISAGTGISNGPIDWHGGSFTYVAESIVPKAELDAAVGGPASVLFDHPYLTPEILVGAVFSSTEGGRTFVTVSMDMPRHHFCSVTGRMWREDEDEVDEDVIVPFKLRAV